MSATADGLAGRESALATIAGVLDAVAAGEPGFLAVVGEPGIGKTCLMERLQGLAAGREWLVLSGRAAEFERELPFAVLVDALDDHLAGLDHRRVERVGGERLAELAAIFPSLDGPAVPEGALQAERYRAHRAIQELLDGLAVGRPLLLVLDDLHWADQASLEVVASLLRRPPDGPVLLACAFRPSPAPQFLEAALAVAEREGRATRIDLGPLTLQDATGLLTEIADPGLRDAVFRVSGGNPFYLAQLARQAVAAPAARGADTMTLGVPQSVMSMLAEEVRGLPADTRRVLESAAVAGEPFEPDVAAEVAELSESEVAEALDELLARDLVRPTDVPRQFRFRHPLVRRAVYAHAGGGWRLAAHGRAAAALEARGAGAAAQAHHVEHSARRGDEAAIALLREAAAASSARAPATAARWLQAAVRLVPEDKDHPGVARRVELLIELADALRASGRLEPCRATLEQALALLEPGDPRRVRLITFCAAVEHWLGRHEEARVRLDAALHALGDERSAGAVHLRVERAVEYLHALDFTAAGAIAAEAAAIAGELGDPVARAVAGAVLTLTDAAAGEITAARERLPAAVAALDALSDAELAGDLAALWYLGWAEVYLEQFDAGLDRLSRGIAVSRASGRGDLLVPLLLSRARAALVLGRTAEATELTDEAMETARGAGNPHHVVWALWAGGRIALQEGDNARAQVLAEEAAHVGGEVGPALLSPAEPAWTLGAALLEAGEIERGRATVLEAIGGPDAPRVIAPERPAALQQLCRAALRAGDLDDAAAWAERAVEDAAALGLALPGARAERAAGVVRLARGDVAGALASGRRSLAAAEGIGARLEAEYARVLVGRALAASGDTRSATAELTAAEAALDAMRARRGREEAAQELRKLGHRVARKPRSAAVPAAAGLAELTGREREIAELVTERHTNRSIAGELFLSEKTVETHLRNIFVKLGVASRVEVARAVERARSG